MLTAFDKAMVPVLAAAITWLNQKYGYHFDASSETLTLLIGAASSIIVYFVPNKQVQA